jgi:hypothetical protein
VSEQQILQAGQEAMTEALRLWSVTSLSKAALGNHDRILGWAVKETAIFAVDKRRSWAELDRAEALDLIKRARFRKSSAAMARGTNLHKAAEALALGTEPKVDKAVRPYVEQVVNFLHDFQPEFEMSEAPVYNVTHGYAGTLDGIVVIDGKRVIFDIKTTEWGPDAVDDEGRPKARPPFSEVALQLVAYRHAEFVGVLAERRYAEGKRYYIFDPNAHHEPMPQVDGAVCVVVSPVDYIVVPIRNDEQVWKAWRHVMETARWQIETSRNVFGPPITPRQEVAA